MLINFTPSYKHSKVLIPAKVEAISGDHHAIATIGRNVKYTFFENKTDGYKFSDGGEDIYHALRLACAAEIVKRRI